MSQPGAAPSGSPTVALAAGSPRRRLAELLLERSFLENHETPFLLASGKTSPFYFECSLTTTWPPAMTLIGSLVHELVRDKVKAIGGPTMGADPISAAVSYHSASTSHPLPWFSIRKARKDHGVGGGRGGRAAAGGEPVALVDDVLTRGTALRDWIRRARGEGLNVRIVVVLLDRQEQEGRQRVEAACSEIGAEFVAVLTRAELDQLRAERA